MKIKYDFTLYFLVFISFILVATKINAEVGNASVETLTQKLATASSFQEMQKTIDELVQYGEDGIDPVLRIGFHPTERNLRAVKSARMVLEKIGFDKVVDHLINQIRTEDFEQQKLAADYLNNLFLHPLNITEGISSEEKEKLISEWLTWWQENRYSFVRETP